MGLGRTVVRSQARRRWVIVLAAVAVLCSLPVLVNVWPAHAASPPPGVLRDRMLASARQPYQGYVQSTGLLPLPALPNLARVTALLSGTTEMRTWYAGPDRWRVDVLDGAAERDVYQTPGAQYIWDYGDNQLSEVLGRQTARLPRAADVTPPELVRRLLAVTAADRATALPARRVAGVAAAGLRLTPATPDTTVAHLDIWADPDSGLPLRAEVTARGGERPVFVTRFLEVHPGRPPAALLTPPEVRPGMGFTVTPALDVIGYLDRRLPPGLLPDRLAGQPRHDDPVTGSSVVGVYGTGLAQFVAVALPGGYGAAAYEQVARFGRPVTVPVGGAALIATGLVTVLAVQAERTYLVAGLVRADVLERAAADLAGAAA